MERVHFLGEKWSGNCEYECKEENSGVMDLM